MAQGAPGRDGIAEDNGENGRRQETGAGRRILSLGRVPSDATAVTVPVGGNATQETASPQLETSTSAPAPEPPAPGVAAAVARAAGIEPYHAEAPAAAPGPTEAEEVAARAPGADGPT